MILNPVNHDNHVILSKNTEVILIYIPVRSAGGGLTGKAAFQAAQYGEPPSWRRSMESRHLGDVSRRIGGARRPAEPRTAVERRLPDLFVRSRLPCSALFAQGPDGPPFSDWERERRGSPQYKNLTVN